MYTTVDLPLAIALVAIDVIMAVVLLIGAHRVIYPSFMENYFVIYLFILFGKQTACITIVNHRIQI